jgi:5'-hydroxyaverantin dehydrogenase
MTRQEGFLTSEAGVLLNVMGFAPMERVTAAVLQFAANEKLLGRAAGIFPLGNEDLGDDFEGSFAGDVLRKHMGDILLKVGMKSAEAQQSELARMDSATGATTGGVAH